MSWMVGFVARGIAEALQAVGAGATYMQASRVARDRARRFRYDAETGEVRESAHGQLVADWVELFAPIVSAPHRPSCWPAHGSLLLDHIPFRIRAEDASGRGIPGGTVAFDVFCAVGYRAGKPCLWRAEAFSSAHPANWSAFLASLEGEPPQASAFNAGTTWLTTNGRSVSALTPSICSLASCADASSAPRLPSPPAPDTAATS